MLWLLIPIISVVLFISIFLYFPGKIITHILNLKNRVDQEIILGLIVFLPFIFFGRWILPLWVLLFIYLSLCILAVIKYQVKFNLPKIQFNHRLILIIALGVVGQAWTYIASALAGIDNLRFNLLTNHDQAWHMSLINEFVNNFPPIVPGFSGEILHNYHYFYDLLISTNIWLVHGSAYVYLQLIYPVLVSVLYGLSIYRISVLLIKNKTLQIISVFLAYFGNNLAYIWYFLGVKQWQSDSLLLDQPLIYLFNHQTVLSLSLLLYGIILLNIWIKQKYNLKFIPILTLFLTTLAGIKIYAFLVFGISLALVIFIKMINIYQNDRSSFLVYIKNFIIFGSCSMILLGLFYVITFKEGDKFLTWNPGWIVDQFFIRSILPYFKKIASIRAIYQLLGQHFKLFILDSLIAVVFLVVNFQLRLLGLLRKKTNLIEHFLFFSSIIPILFILLFNQKNSAFNIIQFAPYAMISLSILLLINIDKLTIKWIKITAISIYILVSIPTSIKTILAYKTHNLTGFIDTQMVQGLETLSIYPQGSVAVLGQPLSLDKRNRQAEIYRDCNIIGALANKHTYYFDKNQLEVLNINFQDREKFIYTISSSFCDLSWEQRNEIKQRGIKYLIVPSSKKCGPYQIIFDSKEFAILSVNS